MVVERGQVWLTHFDPAFDVERGGSRPALIVSNNVGNRYGPLVIVVPMTSRVEKKRLPTHVWVDRAASGLKVDSLVLAEQVRSVSKQRLVRLLTTLPAEVMAKVDEALKVAMSLD
jgi:mRNA interferase MazF